MTRPHVPGRRPALVSPSCVAPITVLLVFQQAGLDRLVHEASRMAEEEAPVSLAGASKVKSGLCGHSLLQEESNRLINAHWSQLCIFSG